MKNLMILFIMGLFIACSATRGSQNSLNNMEMASLYKIKKIIDEESYYIIYAVRNDSTFKIISYVDNTNVSNCEKIERGNFYRLNLVSPKNLLFGIPVAPNPGIIRNYASKRDMPKKKFHYSTYHADNLDGLCIKEDNE